MLHLESPSTTRTVAAPRLTVLVDSTDDLARLPDLAAAGVDGFQVRAKAVSDAALPCLARLVVGAVHPHGASVMVCDRVDVALAAGADGVHVGADDLPVAEVRRLVDAVRPGLLVGATCRDRDAVVRVAGDGASYAGTTREARAAGAQGVAVIGAVWRHPDPLAAAEVLVSAVA